ncbi:MAG: DsbA family protein [Gammaproteobacteria bacterium]
MTKTSLIVLLALTTFACSAEEPANQTDAAAVDTAEAPVSAPVAVVDDETSIALAQEMDDAEAIVEDDENEEEIVLAAATQESAELPPQLERFQPGTHYRLMTPVQPTSVDPGKVEVLEIFWYGCPHCYTLEPHMQEWVKNKMPANAEFVQIPAALNRGWQVHARAFYTAEALGRLDEMHEGMFKAVNVDRNPLNTEDQLVEFFGNYGVSKEEFLEAFNSFAVQTKLRRADSLVRRYRITGVPAVVVNGKYVTGADVAGGVPELFEVVDFLIEKESS